MRLDAPRKVGSTPSTAQGWRPISDRTQPASTPIHGKGMIATAVHRIHLASHLRRVTRMKAAANTAICRKPIPAIIRNAQNITGTLGTVSQAAFWMVALSAVRGSAT